MWKKQQEQGFICHRTTNHAASGSGFVDRKAKPGCLIVTDSQHPCPFICFQMSFCLWLVDRWYNLLFCQRNSSHYNPYIEMTKFDPLIFSKIIIIIILFFLVCPMWRNYPELWCWRQHINLNFYILYISKICHFYIFILHIYILKMTLYTSRGWKTKDFF